MKRLKILLNSKIFIIFLLVLTLFQCLLRTNIKPLPLNNKQLSGRVEAFSFNGDRLTMDVKVNSRLIKTVYYIKDLKELDYLETNILYGVSVNLDGAFQEITSPTIPYSFNNKSYLKSVGIYDYYIINNVKDIKAAKGIYKLKNNLYQYLYQKPANYLYLSLIMGNKNYFSTEELNLFNNNGLSHILAISGLHLGIYLAIIKMLCKWFKIPNYLKIIIIIIFFIFFIFYTNFSSSLLRAIIMYSIIKFNNKYKLFNKYLIIIYTFILAVFINPNLIYNAGFWYSIICAFTLINFKLKNNKITKFYKIPLIMFIYTAPLSIYLNYEINFMSIICNILVVPLFSFLMILLFISLVFPFTTNILIFFYHFIERILLIADNIKIFKLNIGHFNIHILIMIYLFLLLFLIYQKKRYLLITILIILLIKVSFLLDTSYHVYYLDVGQGSCSVITAPHLKEVIMIDTGGYLKYYKEGFEYYKESDPASNIIKFLKANNLTKIDTLILSHGDYDHAGNASSIIKSIKVKNIIINYDLMNRLEKDILITARENHVLNISLDTKFNMSIFKENKYNNENDNSNVILVNINQKQFLFMGDAGIKRENDIIDIFKIDNIDFLNIGHHGSDNSSSTYFIDKIKPNNSIISVGKNNRYGHPKEKVLNTLKSSYVYRTDIDGSIDVKIKRNTFEINTSPP